MPTIIEHTPTGRRFFAIGAGYGMSASSRPSFIGGTLFPTTSDEALPLLAVCDSAGRLGWIPTSEVRVVSIDGVSPQDAEGIDRLTDGWRREVPAFECPKCNHVQREVTFEGCCINCGVRVEPA